MGFLAGLTGPLGAAAMIGYGGYELKHGVGAAVDRYRAGGHMADRLSGFAGLAGGLFGGFTGGSVDAARAGYAAGAGNALGRFLTGPQVWAARGAFNASLWSASLGLRVMGPSARLTASGWAAAAALSVSVRGPVLLRGMGSAALRDPKSLTAYTYAERWQLDITHRELINELLNGDVLVPPGSMSAKLMGELTVATGREVGLIRKGNQRWLRLGFEDQVGHGVRMADANRVIAHTHVSGELRFSIGPDSDIAVFTNPNNKLLKQKSSVLIAPNGAAVRLPIPR